MKENLVSFVRGEKDVKRNVRKKAEAMAMRSTAVCLFCLSETNLLLVSGTEGSPLTNWGVFLGDPDTSM